MITATFILMAIIAAGAVATLLFAIWTAKKHPR